MQKKRLKILTAVVLVLLLALLAAGCGAASIPKPQPTQGAKTVTVTGNCDLEIEDNTIIVSGETDLIDGALLHVSVVSQDGMIVDSVKLTKSGDTVEQRFIITEEKYGDSVKTITGFIVCAPSLYGAQPQAVYDAYGKRFENIQGDFVWNDNGIIVLFASETVEFAR